MFLTQTSNTSHVVDDNDYDHITTFLYIFHEMFFITCNNNNQKEDEHSGVYVSWRFTTLAKLSIDVSDVFSHELSRKGLQ